MKRQILEKKVLFRTINYINEIEDEYRDVCFDPYVRECVCHYGQLSDESIITQQLNKFTSDIIIFSLKYVVSTSAMFVRGILLVKFSGDCKIPRIV